MYRSVALLPSPNAFGIKEGRERYLISPFRKLNKIFTPARLHTSVTVLVKLELTYKRTQPIEVFCSEDVIQKRSFILCLMKMSDLTLIDRGGHGKVDQSSSLRLGVILVLSSFEFLRFGFRELFFLFAGISLSSHSS
jgi:hypothetical protein